MTSPSSHGAHSARPSCGANRQSPISGKGGEPENCKIPSWEEAGELLGSSTTVVELGLAGEMDYAVRRGST